MAKLSIFGTLTNVQMLIHTLLKGKKVGTDFLGNVYYRGKARPGPGGFRGRERRWVIYKNKPEASTVPPEWHGWLHHQNDVVPANDGRYRKPWQKPHKANLTGTDNAYTPPGLHGHRDAASADYTAWKPAE